MASQSLVGRPLFNIDRQLEFPSATVPTANPYRGWHGNKRKLTRLRRARLISRFVLEDHKTAWPLRRSPMRC